MRNLKSWKKTWQVQEKTFLRLSRLISHSVTLQQSLALNCPLFLKQTSFSRQQFDTCLLRIQKNFFSLWVFTETLNDSIVFLVAFFFLLFRCFWYCAFDVLHVKVVNSSHQGTESIWSQMSMINTWQLIRSDLCLPVRSIYPSGYPQVPIFIFHVLSITNKKAFQ